MLSTLHSLPFNLRDVEYQNSTLLCFVSTAKGNRIHNRHAYIQTLCEHASMDSSKLFHTNLKYFLLPNLVKTKFPLNSMSSLKGFDSLSQHLTDRQTIVCFFLIPDARIYSIFPFFFLRNVYEI